MSASDHVYLVEHVRDNAGADDIKTIGVFSSTEKAEEAVEFAKKLPGFIDHQEGFNIDKYVIDKIHWDEGFVSVYPSDDT